MFKKKKTANYSNKSQIAKLIGINVSSTLVTLIINALIVAFIGLKFDLGEGVLYYLTYLIIGITAFSSAYIIAKSIKSKGWLIGIAANALLLIVLSVTHFFLNTDVYGKYFFIKVILILACGVLGGILGVNHKKKVR